MKPPRVPDSLEPMGIDKHLQTVSKVLSNISFGSDMNNKSLDRNVNCWKASGVAPGAANTEFTITHGLGRIPLTLGGYDTNNGGVIYRSATAWTKTQVFLKCTVASSAYNLVII